MLDMAAERLVKGEDEDALAVHACETLREQREGRTFPASAAAGQPDLFAAGDAGQLFDKFVDDDVVARRGRCRARFQADGDGDAVGRAA